MPEYKKDWRKAGEGNNSFGYRQGVFHSARKARVQTSSYIDCLETKRWLLITDDNRTIRKIYDEIAAAVYDVKIERVTYFVGKKILKERQKEVIRVAFSSGILTTQKKQVVQSWPAGLAYRYQLYQKL